MAVGFIARPVENTCINLPPDRGTEKAQRCHGYKICAIRTFTGFPVIEHLQINRGERVLLADRFLRTCQVSLTSPLFFNTIDLSEIIVHPALLEAI